MKRGIVWIMAYQLGPSGGTGGEPFSDSPGTINQIIVHHGAYVDGIEIGWNDGTTSKHGEGGGPNVDTFILNPDEHLTAIDGTIGNLPDDGGPYVVSIRFVVSTGNTVRRSAILGADHGTCAFQYTAPSNASIVGFFGRSGKYLDAIGVLLQ